MSKNLEPVELDRSECARDGFLWQNDDPQCHALIQHKQTLFAIHGNTLKSSPIKFRGFSTTHAVGECKIDDSKEECPGRRFLRYSCVCAWPAVTLCTTSTSWRRRSFGNSAWARQQTHHLRLRAFEQQWIRPQPRWETKWETKSCWSFHHPVAYSIPCTFANSSSSQTSISGLRSSVGVSIHAVTISYHRTIPKPMTRTIQVSLGPIPVSQRLPWHHQSASCQASQW